MRLDLATPRISKARMWLRVCRPLLLWFAVFLVAFGYTTHQRLLQKTRLLASMSLAGNEARYLARVSLDGRNFELGERVPLGRHDLLIQCPKADDFRTNLFIWYGEHNLGTIALRRSEGSLEIQATPAAVSVKIKGPELQTAFTNVSSKTLPVPTDDYTVTAVYEYFTVEKTVTVEDRQKATCSFAPAVGGLQVTAAQTDTRFEFRRVGDSQADGRILTQGKLPATLLNLQEGTYRLRATREGLVENREVKIVANRTNQLAVTFPLGDVILESTPSGATIRDEQGTERGLTPLKLEGVPAGAWRADLVLANYMTASVTVEVIAQQTTTLRTNLVRRAFGVAMELARRMKNESSGDFAPVVEAFSEAVKDDPTNVVAAEMLQKARVGQAMMAADKKSRAGDYVGALHDAETALAIMPENAEAKRLVANLKKTVEENQSNADAAKKRQAAALREQRPREYFAELMRKTPDSEMFKEIEMKIPFGVDVLRLKLVEELSSGLFKFAIEANEQPFEEGFYIRGKMGLLDGWRRCYIVAGQTSDGEVTLRFKVFEYTWPPELALSALLSKPSEDKAIPINTSRLSPQLIENRRAQGIQQVTDRIRKAVGK